MFKNSTFLNDIYTEDKDLKYDMNQNYIDKILEKR